VACLDEHGALSVIPNKRAARSPGRVMSNEGAYTRWNRIERGFAKAKQYRRLATRYEMLREVFLGLVRPVFDFIHI
jgi:transposase